MLKTGGEKDVKEKEKETANSSIKEERRGVLSQFPIAMVAGKHRTGWALELWNYLSRRLFPSSSQTAVFRRL